MGGFSLGDVLDSPRDPELLQRHLQNLGIVPTLPTEQPAEPLVPPMLAAKPLSGPAANVPMRPATEPMHVREPAMIPAMKSAELAGEPPTMGGPPAVPANEIKS